MSRADRERLAGYMQAVMTASAAEEEDICETEGHDFVAEDVADGVVGGGADHVTVIYCSRCDAEGDPEDLE